MATLSKSCISGLICMALGMFGQPVLNASQEICFAQVRTVLECLLQKDYVLRHLAELGLHPGSQVSIRYHTGRIAGLSRDYPEVQIAVYSADSRHGWLFLAYFSDWHRLTPVENSFRLRVERRHWEASEGNGGLATYRAMSRFANDLYKLRPLVTTLRASTASCPKIE